jgi:polyphosphate kinase
MMHRNLDRRIEVLVKLTDPHHIDQVTTHLDRGMGDEVSSWHLHPSGEWVRHATDKNGAPLPDIQNDTMTFFATRPRAGAKR